MKKTKIIILLIIALLSIFFLYNFTVHKTEVAELTQKERLFFSELFKQKSILDSHIEGDLVFYVRGEVKGKTFESKYSPDQDIFGLSNCGVLPNDLLIILRKRHPNISSESYSLKFFNENKTYSWMSIQRWISDDRVVIIVGKSGIEVGTSSALYEMSNVDGKWIGELISVKTS